MNIRPAITLLIIYLISAAWNAAYSQEMMLTEVAVDTSDLTARVSPRYDLNGELCALLKIQCNVPIVIDGNIIGDVISAGSQTWAYVKSGTKKLVLNPSGNPALELNFIDWGIESVKSGDCLKVEIEDLMNLDEWLIFMKGKALLERKLYPQALQTFGRLRKIAKNEEILTSSYLFPGIIYLEQGEVKKAFEVYEEMPQNSYKDICIGILYVRTKDIEKGIPYLERAEKEGREQAVSVLFSIYAGNIKPEYKNQQKALEYGIKMATKGNADAQLYVAVCHYAGLGVTKNIPLAIEYYTMAANQGKVEAQRMLGAIYTVEETKDLTKAKHWLKLAAAQNDQDAIKLLKELGE